MHFGAIRNNMGIPSASVASKLQQFEIALKKNSIWSIIIIIRTFNKVEHLFVGRQIGNYC
jgi:hypothetical protein